MHGLIIPIHTKADSCEENLGACVNILFHIRGPNIELSTNISETAKSAILIMVGSRENFYQRLERRI